MARKKIYHLVNKENSSEVGAWLNRKQALSAARYLEKETGIKRVVEAREAKECPMCGRLTAKDNIENFGECLVCDHLRGEVY